ncbi:MULTISPECIES: aldose epimerase family protein [unclassified Sphingobium]|uniref:aldose epimerase family protein n=1 Tax=unclassified Sphingobium TaxID=2611147 RepID=UPI000D17C300|nr:MULTISPECIES: aldose epimerase family protein [unclassified Sphingobium]MBG6118818.1 aldose 1-epimerase [Sphingobium sp. JAI105]PSO13560.1 galactose-1-epimerase [Sphingobium sp. AEW4]TWD10552.1 aldose 1-epimerase [Sphingobium sp. AEW010]TWD28043.1 aldose 1-epimerase [Sphingobium sp. AEW013]TWD28886.1 aldose 1-epimerase [Sphingobium sp. AEW001]
MRNVAIIKTTLSYAVALALTSGAALAAEATRAPAGTLADGTAVEVISLTNKQGISARILTYGATLQSLSMPDKHGKTADVLLGYDDLKDYVDHPNYFGVTVGRYANRIAGGAFSIDGKAYQLPLNDKTNSLHGGGKGFDKQVWKVASVKSGPVATLVLTLTSADGDSGYPGKLDSSVTYTLDEAGNLGILFDAKTDKPTIVNMTNHAIFNLGGEGSPDGALGHLLTIPAKAYTPVDEALIPTGERKPVDGSVFDFRQPRRVADGIRDGRDPQIVLGRGYDHNWALDKGLTKTPELAARLEDPVSGRVVEVLTTEPGVQFYAGNFLDGTLVGKGGHLYRMGDGIALEPQKFPDAPNKPNFVSARVDPGKPYHHAMVYRLSVKR